MAPSETSASGDGPPNVALAEPGNGCDPASGVDGLAWGAAATSLPGSRMPRPEDIDRASVHLHDVIDYRRTLKRS